MPGTVLITAGGTREAIDDVRSIRNVATGALPAAMAEVWLAQGAHVVYLHGPDALLPGERTLRRQLTTQTDDDNEALAAFAREIADVRTRLAGGRLTLLPVESAAQALQALESALTEHAPTVVACAMAVADFAPDPVVGKIASRQDAPGAGYGQQAEPGGLTLELRPTQKVIDAVKRLRPQAFLLGFKLLSGATEPQLCAAAGHLARRAGADVVFANDLQTYRQGRREGLLVDASEQVLQRLDGGAGSGAQARLAALLVAACPPPN